MPHGCQFCAVVLEDDEKLILCLEDLPEFYHRAGTSRERAKTNLIWKVFKGEELKAFSFYTPEMDGKFIVIGWARLPMGDGNAVEYAQSFHTNGLRKRGALRRAKACLP